MLVNFIFLPYLGKVSHNIGILGIKCGLRRKLTQQSWRGKIDEIIQRKEKITLIENEESLENATSIISRDVGTVNAVGFDCEWENDNGKRKPVSLMQLATYSGNCFLFRLNSFQKGIPSSLQEILENRKILKVGVGCKFDAAYFSEDHKVNVAGWLDLRYLAIEDNFRNRRLGLKSLANHYLGLTLQRDWKLRASDWESSLLTESQVAYAAEDALAAIRVFLTQLNNQRKPVPEEGWETWVCKAIEEVCDPYVEVEFDHEKTKFCFVCGGRSEVSSKKVVPKEYVKYFPPIPELRHDRFSVLLCSQCQESYRIHEDGLRKKLSEECDAPIERDADAEATFEKKLKAVKAAKILTKDPYRLSMKRIYSLEEDIKSYYETDTLTEDLINQTATLHRETLREICDTHGYKVFSYYVKVGLIHLLTQWRQLFLESMKPKYLPEYFPISPDTEFLQIKMKMSEYPVDSEVRDFYKLILVGKDGDVDELIPPDAKGSDVTCGSDLNQDFTRGSEQNLSSAQHTQLIDQNYEKR